MVGARGMSRRISKCSANAPRKFLVLELNNCIYLAFPAGFRPMFIL